MPQTDWQDALEALVRRSGGSLSERGGDLAAGLLGPATGGPSAGVEGASAAGLAGQTPGGVASSPAGPIESLGERISELARASQSQTQTLENNTAALAQNTSSRAADAVKTATSSLGGGLRNLSWGSPLVPLISGLVKLFTGGKDDTPPADTAFSLPAPLRIEAGVGSDGTLGGVNYDANAVPRLNVPRTAAPAPQINIQVQAIDSRSFLDHSSEIARAVREAMLESHALSDVVNEL